VSSPRRLSRRYLARPAVEVAPALLGRTLARNMPDGSVLRGRIVEVEAYEPGDPASHGFRRRTARNATMFGRPGHLYVYFTYGNHWMANVVTRREGEPSAVLLRALEPIDGVDLMRRHRGRERIHELCAGPGRLCQAMEIRGELDGEDLVEGSEVWLEAGRPVPLALVSRGGRVGVSVAHELDWRFWVRNDPFVSKGRPGPPLNRRRRRP
jgi:DNA-3-methyladenine glycosylase